MLISKPGDTILENLEHLPLGVEHFKKFLEDNTPDINYEDLISGKHEINHYTACMLYTYFGIDTQFWLNRELLYRAQLKAITEFNSILDRRILEVAKQDHYIAKAVLETLNEIKAEINE